MTISSILTCDFGSGTDNQNNKLRQVSTPVDFDSDDVTKIVSDLRDTLYASSISVGLAAVQIGVLKRVFVANPTKSDRGNELLAINPVLVDVAGAREKMKESCMSVPNRRGPVRRKTRLTLRYSDEAGAEHERVFTDFVARVIQHEMDHLDGILCLDHVEDRMLIEEVDFLTPENYPLPPTSGSDLMS